MSSNDHESKGRDESPAAAFVRGAKERDRARGERGIDEGSCVVVHDYRERARGFEVTTRECVLGNAMIVPFRFWRRDHAEAHGAELAAARGFRSVVSAELRELQDRYVGDPCIVAVWL